MRLLKLPDEVRAEVASGALSMGHARALLALADEAAQRRVARDVIARSLSVRETEALVKKIVEAGAPRAKPRRRSRSTSTRAPRKSGCASRSARASASCARAQRGRIEIDFASRRRTDPDLRAAHRQELDSVGSSSSSNLTSNRSELNEGTMAKRLTQMVSCAG